ncbi:transcription antitermination factor NusB [Hyunsoonleella flava]|uniref:Transcription antitermination factor NusB n=2 Tax=Hyunsoonleella flava TaxID=2527939 RepID=A0A4Q9FGE0_9FLAO|nr:transcription antitermination factor NusB [Hyunsoonleella flava]
MQTIYAFRGSESDDLKKDEKFLLFSIENMYSLYLLMMSLLLEVQKRAVQDIENKQKKHLATSEDKNPNRKFVNNQVFQLIAQNEAFMEQIKDNSSINWELDNEYIDIIFKAITKSDVYNDYMQTRTSDFKEDKDVFIDIFKEVVAPNDKLYDYIEDKNLTWLDDLPTVNTTILKLLRKLKLTSSKGHFTPKLYKDTEDKQFAIDLFTKTILNTKGINEEIAQKTKNWDADRIASLDYVLLQMGICELQHFPSIPVKVTINEYLEIAKEYSTPKSSIFINGILDKLVKEYKKTDKLNKVGRGLM